MSTTTRGVLFVHSAPSALCPHVEWAAAGVLGAPATISWQPQPVERSTYRTELSWAGEVGTAAKLATALKGWQRIRYEVTEEPSGGADGVRYCYTPTLGVYAAAIGQHGDVMIPEERIKQAIISDALGRQDLHEALDQLLGTPWDDELEPFRYAGAHTPVRWLHQVV